MTQRLTSSVTLPSQVNFAAVEARALSSERRDAVVRANVPITVPSFGATDRGKLAACRLPAPVMFCGTMVGLPGNVLADVPRQQPSIGIVAAAHAVADEQGDGLALVEVLDAPESAGRGARAATTAAVIIA